MKHGFAGAFRRTLLCAFALGAGSCGSEHDVFAYEAQTRAEQEAVYGNDDRMDYWEVTDVSLQDLTHNSIVALFRVQSVDDTDPDDIRILGRTLGEAEELCDGERFLGQPAVAECSGTLIDDDLVLTAGHCVDPLYGDCGSTYRLVFNYYYESDGVLAPITQDDVYACRGVVVSMVDNAGMDYAIVQLDRPVGSGHEPAAVSSVVAPVSAADSVTIIGFGSGLPAKIDTGGQVIDPRASHLDYFVATPDAFGGSSGAGVFNPQDEAIGILVRGETDFELDGQCWRAATYPPSHADAEDITYAWRAIEELCDSGWPSERLCNQTGTCGDGICSLLETSTSCAADCTSVCGNDACELEEYLTCSDDCGRHTPQTAPAEWECELSFYDTRDGCDCECGVRDPDCDEARQHIYGCYVGETCNAEGACEEIPGFADWICDPDYFSAADGCDCDCGAVDPDCLDPGSELFNCFAGQICSDEGECVDADGKERKSSDGSSVSGCGCAANAGGTSSAAWVLGVMGAMFWCNRKRWRRR